MSAEDSWRGRRNLMGPDSLNNLDRWRADNARREEERAKERERRQCEELNAVAQLRAETQREIANLRNEVHQMHEVAIEATGQALGEYGDKIIDHAAKMIEEIKHMLSGAIERRCGELMGRLDALAPGAPSRSKSFKFANEPDDVIDLPNPLRKGMN
jgi:hypothetical protein